MFEKDLKWEGSSYADVCAFPERARREAGYQLGFIQQGLDPEDWKPMRSVGTGVREIRIHVAGEFRIIYVAKREKAIYVLHAFQKKTKRTRKQDVDIAKKRLRDIAY